LKFESSSPILTNQLSDTDMNPRSRRDGCREQLNTRIQDGAHSDLLNVQ